MILRLARRCTPILPLVAFVLVVVLLFPPRAAWAAQERDEGTIGVYVTSLRDFDTAGDSFGIDYWMWSIHPPGTDPLDGVEFVNAKQVEDIRLNRTIEQDGVAWSRRKVRARVLHNWNLVNFPFDRQTLSVDLGLSGPDLNAYRVDDAGSGYADRIVPVGWRVTDFKVEKRVVEDDTAYGNPEAGAKSSQEHVFVTFEMQRDTAIGFLKLLAGVYAAIAIALLSFLMVPEAPPVFSGRMTVLVGALFAIVVNMQVSNNVLGSPETVSLVDEIHIVALFYVFGAALMAIVSRMGYDAGHAELAHRRDIASLLVFGVSFVIINGVLISLAYASG